MGRCSAGCYGGHYHNTQPYPPDSRYSITATRAKHHWQITPLDILKNYRQTTHGMVTSYAVPAEDIQRVCEQLYHTDGVYLRTITAEDRNTDDDGYIIHYVFSIPAENRIIIPFLTLKNTDSFPSLAPAIFEATYYEREIATMFGLRAEGHPLLQPIILHENWPVNTFPLRKEFAWNTRPTYPATEGMRYRFQKIEGEGIYEIPVGPVHAGIIEPGHFRFSVVGEEIVSLEPMLGYVHKGTEKLFETLPFAKKVQLAERVSGDSSVSHALAFCQAVEQLAGVEAPHRAQYIRMIGAELERIANHLGDMGLMLNDTGYSFGGANGGRMREIIMLLAERTFGHRFMRGVVTYGGVTRDITEEQIDEIDHVLVALKKDFMEFTTIAEDSESVINRMKGTGALDHKVAWDHGVVGVAARGSGMAIDIRKDHPYARYADVEFENAVHVDGDVYARYQIRKHELLSSISIIHQVLKQMKKGSILHEVPEKLPANTCAVSMVEGWRGDIVYMVTTDSKGTITRVAVRDPSFLNWHAVPYAVAGEIVPDFPLVNKSFNLSYSGYDR